jgi:hypothetical protein
MIIDEAFDYKRPLTPQQREHLQQWFAGLVNTLKIEKQRTTARKKENGRKSRDIRKAK